MTALRYLLFVVFFLIFAPVVSASSDFTTDFHSIYTVKDSEVQVEHIVSLTNNTSHLYTTSYMLAVGGGALEQVTATNGTDVLPVNLSTLGEATTIKVTLTNPLIGEGKVNTFHIKYNTRDLVTRIGNNRELNIPRVTRANEFRQYSRDVIVPSTYGTATYQYPSPTHVEQGDTTTYTYTGSPGESLSLLFGASQVYHLNLGYTISNPTLTKAKTEIALPPPTSYQDIILEKITPSPRSISIDKDGNWLATYELKSHEKLDIEASLYATVYPVPKPSLQTTLSASSLGADSNWPVGDKTIKTLSHELGSVPHIYSYLIDNFSYDYTRLGGERLGASKALASPALATCTEFTDTFVALTRALGIPSRELNGYAYGSTAATRPQAEDRLHAWPEYFDQAKGVWRQVDPTWGSTTGGLNYFDKLDYGHITFVIHGEESTYPLPAGAYEHRSVGRAIEVTPLDTLPEGLVPNPLTPNPSTEEQPATSLWERLLAFLHGLF